MTEISTFLKYHRKKINLTQEELANKAGVGLRFIREMEQGKQTLQLDKVNQVLSLFGFCMSPTKLHIDPYFIFWNFLNKAIKITLNNKIIKYGIIIKELLDNNGSNIVAWKFVSNNNAIKYQKNDDDKLTETILHSDIQNIEEQ